MSCVLLLFIILVAKVVQKWEPTKLLKNFRKITHSDTRKAREGSWGNLAGLWVWAQSGCGGGVRGGLRGIYIEYTYMIASIIKNILA